MSKTPSTGAQVLKNELTTLLETRLEFTVADLIANKDQILGHLGTMVSQAAILEDQLKTAESAQATFEKSKEALGGWVVEKGD